MGSSHRNILHFENNVDKGYITQYINQNLIRTTEEKLSDFLNNLLLKYSSSQDVASVINEIKYFMDVRGIK